MKKEFSKLEQAVIFATQCHKGQTRKGTNLPYITHPIEVAQILLSAGADENLVVAGLLHDVVEDTDTSIDTVAQMFGDDVAQLVSGHSEDKSKTWDERKLHTITELPKEDVRSKMLTLADKLANLRTMYRDFQKVGDDLWGRFNAPKEKISWYYSGIVNGLDQLQYIDDTRNAYWEFSSLYKDMFVDFFVSRNEDDVMQIYQVACHGEAYRFDSNRLLWTKCSFEPSCTAYRITRMTAEKFVDDCFESNISDKDNMQ